MRKHIYINLSIESTRNVKIYVITSGITTFCYFIFSIYFISRPGFDYFISENQIDTGNVSIEINTGLANIEQLIFVFLLNFIALFLISLFIRKKDLNVRNKKFK
ncbi:Msa family membrane protein [Staphylococcus succinus]|uniref:Uncharacterized protein n=1 Tax=Staphylococcus succinus TaxID=61015 RepID=A0A9Q6HMP7_9STAP|nr:Msa family membrane protein [Staphylococcus succinus]PTI74308.1 hypothetical protein BU058_11360 [Staphylococcus succinus]